jgi:hypothetical protein
MPAAGADDLPNHLAPTDHVPVTELIREQGVKPITSVADMCRPGVFESDEELDDFLADLYASRRAGMA